MDAAEQRLPLRDRLLVGLAGHLGPIVLRALGGTWRVEVLGEDNVGRARGTGGRALIYAFWHGQLLPLEYIRRGSNIHVLSSWHRDGEISARLMRGLGYGVVRGSTSRGSTRGLVLMIRKSIEGHDLAVTPDGPRGPARTVERGIFYLAEKSGATIVPVAVAASRAKRLSSWDRFMIPLPFARVVLAYGEAFATPPRTEFDEAAEALRDVLDRLTEVAQDRASRGARPPSEAARDRAHGGAERGAASESDR